MSDERRRRLERAAATDPSVTAALQREIERQGGPRLHEGVRYVMHVLPGTILRATIHRVEGRWVEIVSAQWLELTTENGSPWQLALGRPDTEVIRRAWTLADHTLIDSSMIVMASPCAQ